MLETALHTIGVIWNRKQLKWMLGGSSSLLLQGVELTDPPNDIDIYADFEVAKQLHHMASIYSVDEQRLDRSGLYTSLLSHYQIEQASVELSGGFEVCASESLYRTDIDFLLPYANTYIVPQTGESIYLTPLCHELLFNILRRRADRYEPIAKKMNDNVEAHMPLLRKLIARNVWSEEILKQLESVMVMK